jgi:uncharacterized protein (TIGR01244 family)
MPDRMKFNEDVTIGAQPSEAELKAMAEEGVRTVINLRTEDESMQRMEPDEESDASRRFGIACETIPVSMDEMGPETVDDFRSTLAQAEKPVFVHCKLGKRAGAMVMMDVAVRQGWSGEEAIRRAKEMGFECENEQMTDFVRNYIDEHQHPCGDSE